MDFIFPGGFFMPKHKKIHCVGCFEITDHQWNIDDDCFECIDCGVIPEQTEPEKKQDQKTKRKKVK